MLGDYRVEQIARVTHEANRALQMIQNDPTIPVSVSWDELPEENKESVIDGVVGVLEGNSPEESHANWVRFKKSQGWKFGPVKDEVKKEHPLLIPYEDLPMSQKIKDDLFSSIIHTLG